MYGDAVLISDAAKHVDSPLFRGLVGGECTW
jgi:hypothetical protein